MAKTDKRRKATRLPRAGRSSPIRAAADKKAIDLVVLDLRKAAGFTDYFVICSGTNPRQIRAIADSVTEALAATASSPRTLKATTDPNGSCSTTSTSSSTSSPRRRAIFYGLERLWGNAEQTRRSSRLIARVLGSAARRAADSLLTVVCSRRDCAACGDLLEHPTHGPVCDACWRSILPLTPPLCDRCGDPLPSWRSVPSAARSARRCRDARGRIDRPRPRGRRLRRRAPRNRSRAQVRGRRSLARPLAALMRSAARMCWAAPTASCRCRSIPSGAESAASIRRPISPGIRAAGRATRCGGFARRGTQADLPAAHGTATSAARLPSRAAAGRDAVEGIVVLVDDVSTTGATLEACALVLKEAGAREVRALTAARVVTARGA